MRREGEGRGEGEGGPETPDSSTGGHTGESTPVITGQNNSRVCGVWVCVQAREKLEGELKSVHELCGDMEREKKRVEERASEKERKVSSDLAAV